MDRAALIQEITKAFDGVSREDGVTLHQARVIDDRGTPEEEAAARTKDRETRWQDVPEDEMRFKEAMLSFLDDKGFRYYLPAYLICYLNHMDDVDDPGGHEWMVLFALELNGNWLDEYSISRFVLLNREQSRAVAHFLEFLRDRERQQWDGVDTNMVNALNCYWGQFL